MLFRSICIIHLTIEVNLKHHIIASKSGNKTDYTWLWCPEVTEKTGYQWPYPLERVMCSLKMLKKSNLLFDFDLDIFLENPHNSYSLIHNCHDRHNQRGHDLYSALHRRLKNVRVKVRVEVIDSAWSVQCPLQKPEKC